MGTAEVCSLSKTACWALRRSGTFVPSSARDQAIATSEARSKTLPRPSAVARWAAAGNGGHTAIYPGGCHVFARYPSPISEQALELIDRFLMALA